MHRCERFRHPVVFIVRERPHLMIELLPGDGDKAPFQAEFRETFGLKTLELIEEHLTTLLSRPCGALIGRQNETSLVATEVFQRLEVGMFFPAAINACPGDAQLEKVAWGQS